MPMPSGDRIGSLMSADDIIILANSEADLNKLKEVLEDWCRRYRMKISLKKTQVITPDKNHDIELTDDNVISKLENVNVYKYLGIYQRISVNQTTSGKQKLMLEKSEQYLKLISKMRYTLPDSVETYRAIWENVATPSILYGTECLPISDQTINDLNIIQNKMAKIILGLPTSTANVVTQAELGIKTFKLKIIERKIRFLSKIKCNAKGCEVTKQCVQNLGQMYKVYEDNFDSILKAINLKTSTVVESDYKSN